MGVPVAGVSVAFPPRSPRPEGVAPGATEGGAPGGILTTEGTPTTGPALGGLARTSGLGTVVGLGPAGRVRILVRSRRAGHRGPDAGARKAWRRSAKGAAVAKRGMPRKAPSVGVATSVSVALKAKNGLPHAGCH
jgi:hypothetical protein